MFSIIFYKHAEKSAEKVATLNAFLVNLLVEIGQLKKNEIKLNVKCRKCQRGRLGITPTEVSTWVRLKIDWLRRMYEVNEVNGFV